MAQQRFDFLQVTCEQLQLQTLERTRQQEGVLKAMQDKHNEAATANEHLEQQLSHERKKAFDQDHQQSKHTQQLVTDLQNQVQDLLDQRQAYQLEAQKGSESLKRVISELEETNQALQQ